MLLFQSIMKETTCIFSTMFASLLYISSILTGSRKIKAQVFLFGLGADVDL